MNSFKAFLAKKDIEISLKRYGIDALGAMAQGLFCSLLIGTIINTIGMLFNIGFLLEPIATIGGVNYTVGGLATLMSGPAMAVAIGKALKCPALVLFSLVTAGFASNALGGAGGPLAVLFVAIITAEIGKMVAGSTKVDILVTPLVTVGVGVFLSWLIAPALGKAASSIGGVIMWSTELQPAIPYGNCCICDCWNCADSSYIKCCHMCCIRAYRSCRRSCRCRMLCTDGWICSYVI